MKQKQCTVLCCTIPVDIVILRTNFNIMGNGVTQRYLLGRNRIDRVVRVSIALPVSDWLTP